MFKRNQDGGISGLGISFVLTVLLLIGAVAFGVWAFAGRQDYKNNVDAKIKTAEAATTQKVSTADNLQFAAQAKQPLKTYSGPEAYGSLQLNFPKTWSGYVDDTGKGSALVDGYFAPGVVPSATDQGSIFALRVQVLNQPYVQALQTFAGQQQAGQMTISAYALPKLPNIVGVKVSGQLQQGAQTVTMVVLPLRSDTLEISTEGSQYLDDFNNNILANFTFSP